MSYEVKFTAGSSADGFIVDFCNDSPIVGQTCTAPNGMDASSAQTDEVGATLTPSASTLKVVEAISAGAVDVTFTGIDNPSDAGTLYARILTYNGTGTGSDFADYAAGVEGSPVETGGAAMAITNDVSVSAAVRETMTFCVASASITADCANANDNPPTLEIGQGTAGQKALQAGTVSTADIYTLLSTNAASGAVVKLRSNATGCGGLVRAGNANCDIKPADGTTVIVDNTHAGFGIKAAANSGTAVSGSGGTSGNLVPASGYDSSTYKLKYASNGLSGVTSAYGDDLLTTDEHQVSNEQLQMTFGASITNLTPAGIYKATLNMIATGTY